MNSQLFHVYGAPLFGLGLMEIAAEVRTNIWNKNPPVLIQVGIFSLLSQSRLPRTAEYEELLVHAIREENPE